MATQRCHFLRESLKKLRTRLFHERRQKSIYLRRKTTTQKKKSKYTTKTAINFCTVEPNTTINLTINALHLSFKSLKRHWNESTGLMTRSLVTLFPGNSPTPPWKQSGRYSIKSRLLLVVKYVTDQIMKRPLFTVRSPRIPITFPSNTIAAYYFYITHLPF